MAIGTQTIVSGTAGRTTYNTSGQSGHIRDVEPQIKMLLPYATPIENWFMSRSWMEEETTGIGGKKEWYEDAFLPSNTTMTDGITGGATSETITVANPIFIANDTLIVEDTNQFVRVSAVSGNDVTIYTPNGSNLTASPANGQLQRLSPAFIEGGDKAESITVVATLKYAYPQIIKKALKMSGTQQASGFYGAKGGDWKYQWIKKLQEFREEIERMYLQNPASYDDRTTSQSRTISAGLQSLSTNRFSTGGTLDKTDWSDGLKAQFQYTNSTMLDAFCGGEALNDFDTWMSTIWNIQQNQPDLQLKGYGLLTTSPQSTMLVRYRHPMGYVNIHYNPQLKSKYAHDVVVLDDKNIKKIYMAPDEDGARKYRLEMDIKTRGADVKESQYLAHIGLAIQLEETHSRFES